jgi:hypothetical protein
VFETLPAQTYLELGETFFYGIQGSDINPGQQDTLRVTRQQGPSDSVLTNLAFGTATLSWKPSEQGNYTFTLQLADASSLASTQTFTIEVRAAKPVWHWAIGPSAPGSVGEVACGVIDNILYVVGKETAQTFAYDTLRQVWLDTTGWEARPFPGNHHSAEVYNGLWYLVGGFEEQSVGKVQVRVATAFYQQTLIYTVIDL